MSLFNIRKRHARPLRVVVLVLLIGIAAGGYYAYTLYERIFSPNISGSTNIVLFIRPGVTADDLQDSLSKYSVLDKTAGFQWVAKQMSFEGIVKPGRYVLKPGMSNRAVINLFRGGFQEAVLLPIVKKRTLSELAAYVSDRLLLTEGELLNALRNEAFLASIGTTQQEVIGLFLADSYNIFWTTTATELIQRMQQEFDRYWNDDRKAKAAQLGLSPMEVITLASIVEEETAQEREKATVAGLYLNRLKKGWLLQADPTVKYAVGDFALRRILFEHLEVESPYNTYKYKGLPPGPICIPFKSTIEAVLNAEDHDYMYMCAKEDFSGFHNFARTARQHAINRQKYIRALNQRRIYE